MKISVLTVPSRHGFLFCRFTPYFRRVSFLSTQPISRRALGFAAILLYKSRLYRTVPFLLEKGLYPAGYLLIYTLTAALACYQSTVGRLFLPMICKLSLDAIRIRAFLCPDRKRALQAFANLTFAIAYYDHL